MATDAVVFRNSNFFVSVRTKQRKYNYAGMVDLTKSHLMQFFHLPITFFVCLSTYAPENGTDENGRVWRQGFIVKFFWCIFASKLKVSSKVNTFFEVNSAFSMLNKATAAALLFVFQISAVAIVNLKLCI